MQIKEFENISSDTDILHGKPCIKGTRMPVYLIVKIVSDMIADNNFDFDSIIENYPSIQKSDVVLALKYAAKLTEHESYAL